jgi:hypothetical protein
MRDDYRSKVLAGVAGASSGFIVVVLVGALLPPFLPLDVFPADDLVSRIRFALGWLLIPGCSLLVGVWAAARRGFFPDAIDGTSTPTNRGLEINLRYNQNTLEQVVLVMIAWPAFAVLAPHERLDLLPMAAILFGVGRITFWIGYAIRPIARAFGMVLTILPTIAIYGWLIARLI